MKNIKTNFYVASIVFGSLLNASVAFAWGDLGHETVAEIAERNLSAPAKQAVLDILGPEVLAQAAVWPDAVRDDSDFDSFKPYHFATIPTGKTYASLSASERAEKDAYTVLTQYPKLLKKKSTPRSMRIIALRYLVHVVGDVHQPLHIGNEVDMGGNLCEIYWTKGDEQSKSLHSTWDTAIPAAIAKELAFARNPKTKYHGYKEFASDILKGNPLTAEETKKIISASVLDWFSESQSLRTTVAYPDEKKDTAVNDQERPYCKLVSAQGGVVSGKFDSSKIPTLSDEFKTNAKKVVQQRILAAGLRLAHMLNQIFAHTQPGKSKVEMLKDLELKN